MLRADGTRLNRAGSPFSRRRDAQQAITVETENGEQIQAAQIGGKAAQNVADAVSNNLGDVVGGRVLVGNGPISDDLADFSGVAIVSGPGIYKDGYYYNLVGLLDGNMQIGISSDDGCLYAGGGAVLLDERGVTIYDDEQHVISLMGDIAGYYGTFVETWGLGVGDDDNYMAYDISNGFRIAAGGEQAVLIDGDGLTLTAVDQNASTIKWEHESEYVAQHRTRYTGTVDHYIEAIGYDTDGDAALYLEARNSTDGLAFCRIILDSSLQQARLFGTLTATGDVIADGDVMAEGNIASDSRINGEKRNYEIQKAGTATAEHWLICTLPASSSSTLDHVVIRATYGAWTSGQKTYAQILVSNRGGFYEAHSLLGAAPSNSYARLCAYLQADGAMNIYVFLAAGSYSVCSYSVECPEAGVTVVATPTNAGATPPGTWQYTW